MRRVIVFLLDAAFLALGIGCFHLFYVSNPTFWQWLVIAPVLSLIVPLWYAGHYGLFGGYDGTS